MRVRQRKLIKAVRMWKFSCHMCRVQHELGGLYLKEHPVGASSWKLGSTQKLQQETEAADITVDMCQYGLCDPEGKPTRKRTRLLSNSHGLLRRLQRVCPGLHIHQPLEGACKGMSRTAYAQHYTDRFVKRVLNSVEDLSWRPNEDEQEELVHLAMDLRITKRDKERLEAAMPAEGAPTRRITGKRPRGPAGGAPPEPSEEQEARRQRVGPIPA